MKKQILFIATAITATALFSCKKDNSINPPGDTNEQISRIKTWTGNAGTSTYSYDSKGRQVEEKFSSGSKTTFEYLPGSLIQKQYNTAGINDFTYNYELNADGLIVKQTRPSDPSFNEIYVYNTDKLVIKRITTSNGFNQTIDYFYSNGNMDSARTSSNGIWINTRIKTYYTDKTNSIGDQPQGIAFRGKDNKNLDKTEQYKYPNGSADDLVSYQYEYDGMGRVIKRNRSQSGNLTITLITYN